jgi:hypothetical protein
MHVNDLNTDNIYFLKELKIPNPKYITPLNNEDDLLVR